MKMIDKDPLGYSVVTYAWVLLLSVWGGVVHFIQRLKRGEAKAHNIDRKSTRLNSSHEFVSRMPSSA